MNLTPNMLTLICVNLLYGVVSWCVLIVASMDVQGVNRWRVLVWLGLGWAVVNALLVLVLTRR